MAVHLSMPTDRARCRTIITEDVDVDGGRRRTTWTWMNANARLRRIDLQEAVRFGRDGGVLTSDRVADVRTSHFEKVRDFMVDQVQDTLDGGDRNYIDVRFPQFDRRIRVRVDGVEPNPD